MSKIELYKTFMNGVATYGNYEITCVACYAPEDYSLYRSMHLLLNNSPWETQYLVTKVEIYVQPLGFLGRLHIQSNQP
jgi:hypothetical protein